MRHNFEKTGMSPQENAINREQYTNSPFDEKVEKLRSFARQRLENEDELLKFISLHSNNIPNEETAAELAESNTWQHHRVVEGPMIVALLEEYSKMKKG